MLVLYGLPVPIFINVDTDQSIVQGYNVTFSQVADLSRPSTSDHRDQSRPPASLRGRVSGMSCELILSLYPDKKSLQLLVSECSTLGVDILGQLHPFNRVAALKLPIHQAIIETHLRFGQQLVDCRWSHLRSQHSVPDSQPLRARHQVHVFRQEPGDSI